MSASSSISVTAGCMHANPPEIEIETSIGRQKTKIVSEVQNHCC